MSQAASPPLDRRGFALPFTILIVTLMTLMLATSFSRAANEHLMAQGTEATVDVINIAEAGLDAFFHDTSLTRPADGDSVRYNVVGGYAWVFAHELQRPADTIASDVVYVIESRGTLIDPQQGDVSQAARTMMELARWQTGSIEAPAMFTAANGLIRRGPFGTGQLTLMAADANGCPASPPDPSLPRVRTPSSVPSADSYSGLSSVTGGTPLSIAQETGIDWDAIVNGPFVPDMYGVQWGDTTSYLTQMVVGDTTFTSLPASPRRGAGILIVTGDLTFAGNGTPAEEVEWQGIVLVGGSLDARVNFLDLRGIVVTGLNELLGIPVTTPSYLAGEYPSGGEAKDADVVYEGCFVRKALDHLTGWVPMAGTRIDSWSTY